MLEYKYIDKNDNDSITSLNFNECTLTKDDIKTIEKYYKYICSLIDESDSIIIHDYSNFINNINSKIKGNKYIIKDFYPNNIKNNAYIYNIENSTTKNILKKEINFNITDEYNEPLITDIKKKYIANDENIWDLSSVFFIQHNKIIAILYRYDSTIYNYQPPQERKYQEYAKINYNINLQNDYKKEVYNKTEENIQKLYKEIKEVLSIYKDINSLFTNININLLKEKVMYKRYNLFINNLKKRNIIYKYGISITQNKSFKDYIYKVLEEYINTKNNILYFGNKTNINYIIKINNKNIYTYKNTIK